MIVSKSIAQFRHEVKIEIEKFVKRQNVRIVLCEHNDNDNDNDNFLFSTLEFTK